MFKVHSSQLSQAIQQELLSDGPYRVSLFVTLLVLSHGGIFLQQRFYWIPGRRYFSLCQSCLCSSCFPAIDLSHGPASQGPAGPAAATGLTKLAGPVALTPLPGRSRALRCDRSIAGTPLSWNVCPLPDRHQAPALAGQTSSASPCQTDVKRQLLPVRPRMPEFARQILPVHRFDKVFSPVIQYSLSVIVVCCCLLLFAVCCVGNYYMCSIEASR